MTDDRLGRLFSAGTAPERDAAFALRVEAEIGRARLGRRLLPVAVRVLLVLTLAGAAFVTARAIEPMLEPVAEIAPQFMGVPLPLVIAALAAGLAVRARRLVRLRLD
jgi:hypothetical protein